MENLTIGHSQQELEPDLIEMAAIGRRFQIGNLYDYRSDKIVPESLLWNADEVVKLVECQDVIEKNHSIFEYENSSDITWTKIGMDNHLIMSWMSGLVGPFRLGASAYIENYFMSSSLHSCLHIRTLHRHEKLDHNLAKDKLKIVYDPAILEHGNASHVVTAISYGLETYCVFVLNQDEEEEARELLTRAAHQFRIGLFDLNQQKDPPFYENINVWLFADWNKSEEPLRLPYIKAFHLCHEQFSKSKEKSLSIPLTVRLCPLGKTAPVFLTNEYRPIPETIKSTFDCLLQFTNLIRIQMKTWTLIHLPQSDWWPPYKLPPYHSFKLYDSLLIEFLKRFQKQIAESVQNFRNGTMDDNESSFERIISIVKSSIFNPELLSRWIEHQKLWVILTDYIKKTLPDVPVCRNVQEAIYFNDDVEFVLLLKIPLPFSAFNSMLDQMKDYLSKNTNLVDCPSSCQEYLESWTSLDTIRTKVFHSVSRFANFISVNKSRKAKYVIVVDGLADPHFRLYRNEWKDDYKIELPSPPTDFRVAENLHGKLTLTWDMDSFVNVTGSLIEFRRFCDDDLSWTRIKPRVVGQIQLSLTHGEQYVFRVATVTRFGQSEFSEQIGPESISSEAVAKATSEESDIHRENEELLLKLCANRTRNLKEMEALIRRVVNVNCQNSNGSTPFLLIVKRFIDECGSTTYEKNFRMAETYLAIQAIQLLRENDKFNVNCKDKNGFNALHLFCSSYSGQYLLEIIRFFVDIGINVNCKTKKGVNVLHFLCRSYKKENLTEIVQLLIDHGINVNTRNSKRWNALLILCRYYRKENLIEIVRLLIDHGINVNSRDADGMNALLILCRHYRNENLMDIIQLLVDKGIDVNQKSKGWNALLMLSCYNRCGDLINIVRFLIDKGIDVNCADEDGKNVLHFLCLHYNKENVIDIIRLVIEKGIDVNSTDKVGKNALLYTFCSDREEYHVDIIRLLIDKGIDVNCKDSEGWNAILVLSRYYINVDIVQLLVNSGIDIDCRINGKNALLNFCDVCVKNDYKCLVNLMDVVRILVNKGIKINCKGSEDQNDLAYLFFHFKNEKLLDIIRIFIDSGIDINWTESFGSDAFLVVCQNYKFSNRVDFFRLLIDSGIDINCKDSNGINHGIDVNCISSDFFEVNGNALHFLCRRRLCSDYGENLIDEIRVLVDRGIDINCKDSDGFNVLHLLCRCYRNENLIDIIHFLIDHGIDVNCRSSHRSSNVNGNALHFLCKRFNDGENLIDVIRVLVDRGIDINCEDSYGSNALLLLCRWYRNENLIDIIHFLIDHGIDINSKDSNGSNALLTIFDGFSLVDQKLVDIIQLLIVKGIDVNCRNSDGSNALLLLLNKYSHINLIDMVRLLINNGIDVNCKDSKGWNALFVLVDQCYHTKLIDIVPLLIVSGIDINHRNEEGFNALLIALQSKILCALEPTVVEQLMDTVRLLVDVGIDLNCQNKDGWNVLHFWIRFYSNPNLIDTVRYLIDKGLDVNRKNSHGWNALIFLSRFYEDTNLIDIIRLLIDKGIDVNCKGTDGRNALLYLCYFYKQNNLIDIIRLLIDSGIDFNCKGSDGTNIRLSLLGFAENELNCLLDEEWIECTLPPEEEDIDVNNGEYEWNALLFICRHYHHENLMDVVRLLIDVGIDTNCKDANGSNAIAVLWSRYKDPKVFKVIRFLADSGVDFNYRDGKNALDSLWRHTEKEDLIAIIRLFVDGGIDISCQDCEGWSALLLLCQRPNNSLMDIVRLFLDKAIDINSKTKDGDNALTLFIQRYQNEDSTMEFIQLLVDKGIDINSKNKNGWNCLLLLCRYYQQENLIDIVKLLVDKGIDLNCKYKNGWNALNFLCRYYPKENLIDIVQFLVDEGIDVSYKKIR